MTLYHEEKSFLKNYRDKVLGGQSISTEDIIEILDRFEEMTEMTSVTVKMIDRLMKNYDMLKKERSEEYEELVLRKH